MDINYLLWLQEIRAATGGLFDAFFVGLSDFVVGAWAYLMIGLIYWCVNKKKGAEIMFALSSGSMMMQFMKNTFCVYRPWIRDPRIVPVGDSISTATGYSFPSGHTYIATSFFGSVILWLRKNKLIGAISTVFLLLVKFSRNYLGVHTPQDVITSFLLGLVFIWLSKKISIWIDDGKNRDIFVAAIGILVCALFLIYCEFKPYPLDYTATGKLLVDPYKMITDCYLAVGCVSGFLVGWFVERRFVKFEDTNNRKTQILRFIIGGLTTLAVLKGVTVPIEIALGEHWGILVRYFLTIMWMISGVPCLFKYIK